MMTVGGEIKRDTTLVDEYIRQLSDLGISLKSLGILAETDLSDEDKKLTEKELIEKILEDSNYKDKKENIEKYITEFVKADLITQQIHRRRGVELTNYLNGHDDWVDGGVYLYRTKQSGLISTELNTDSDEEVKVVNSTEYVQMQYVTPEEFQELVDKKNKKLRYRYTIDEDTGELKYAQIKTIETIKTDMNYIVNTLFPADTTEIEVEKIISMDYKAYINKYTMPYEFLINLCQITQNPEFVYHVAQLARETTIMLAIQDDTTQEHVTLIEEEFYKTYENNDSNSTSEAKLTSERTNKTKTEIITTTMVPNLQVEFANTWSFFEIFEYSKKIDTETTTNGPLTIVYSLPSTLPNHQEGGTYKEIGAEGVEQEVTKPEKWYGEFLVQKTTTTTTEITMTTYTPAILKNSVEKSKQFLGLLRSSTGKCEHKGNCFDNVQKAKECAKKAEFDKKGINVTYKLPDRTIEEEPYGKLKSGERMLYSLMGEGTQASANIKMEEDATSEYVGRMTGLIDHIKYLMTLPENEDITDYLDGLEDIMDYVPGITDDDDDGNIDVDDGEKEDNDTNISSPSSGKLSNLFPDGIPTTKEEISKYLETIEVPITTKDGKKTTTRVTVHKDIAKDLINVLQKAQDSGFKVYEVQGFSWRTISGSSKMSVHSMGLAVDINVNENYCVQSNGSVVAGSFWKPGSNEYSIPANGVLVNAFKSIGWGWGGSWSSKKDYMHFSYTGG